MTYAVAREKADLLMPQIFQILKTNAIAFLNFRIASDEEDTKQATDLVVEFSGGEIAVRTRFWPCNFRDLTIRSRARYGGKTELDKIKQGYGKFYIYCWETKPGDIGEYVLIDLDILRKHEAILTRKQISNGDGTMFIAIGIDELKECECVITHYKYEDILEW